MTQLGTRSVSCYLFRKAAGETQFLTLLRSPNLELADTWQAVHGRIEPGETATVAARREVAEETGLTPARFYVVDHVELIYDPRADQIVLVPVFTGEIAGDPPIHISWEHGRAEWCDVAETLRRFIWPTQREAVRRIVEDIAEATIPNPLLELSQT